MANKKELASHVLESIDKFNEKSTPFDSGFQFVVEAVNSVQAGIQAIESPTSRMSARATRFYFEQAKEYLSEAKAMLASSPGYSAELRQLMDRYLKFCDRILTQL